YAGTGHQAVSQAVQLADRALDLAGRAGDGRAVIAACHDLNLAARFATHALVLGADRHWLGPAAAVLTAPVLRQAFGCGFDVIDSAHGRLFVPLPA
ncbi:MAG: ABC transporter ATP-binding protein, partial [Burkholderiaceae bacterium]